jgi:hypothetical protein
MAERSMWSVGSAIGGFGNFWPHSSDPSSGPPLLFPPSLFFPSPKKLLSYPLSIMAVAAANGNGHAAPKRPFRNGAYCPMITPFKADESVDHDALASQVVRLAKAGMGIVVLGTNGEGALEEEIDYIVSYKKLTLPVVTKLPISLPPSEAPSSRLLALPSMRTPRSPARQSSLVPGRVLLARRRSCARRQPNQGQTTLSSSLPATSLSPSERTGKPSRTSSLTSLTGHLFRS